MTKRGRQLVLPIPATWGGRRKGAGRKPKRDVAGESHAARPPLSHRHPVHVTLRVLPHVWNLRSRRAFRAIGRSFLSSKEREGFRLVHFSVQGNHLHLIVEASSAQRLSRGMQGLAIWIARRLNLVMERKGRVFADRFHAHQLRSPREVDRAIDYVLGNFARHAARWAGAAGGSEQAGRQPPPAVRPPRPDAYSSAGPEGPALTAPPGTWLLRGGWRQARLAKGR